MASSQQPPEEQSSKAQNAGTSLSSPAVPDPSGRCECPAMPPPRCASDGQNLTTLTNIECAMANTLRTAASDAPQDSSGANRSAPPADNATVPPPAVRFSSAVEEIAPGPAPVTPAADKELTTPPPNVSADELKQFTESLKDHKERPALQQHRMNTFQFEPFSLPASRVRGPPPSGDTMLHEALSVSRLDRIVAAAKAKRGQTPFTP